MASFTSSSEKVGPDERRELEAAGAHVLEQDRERDRGILGAVHRAREPLLAPHELPRVEVEAVRRRAGDRRRRTSRPTRVTSRAVAVVAGSPTASSA